MNVQRLIETYNTYEEPQDWAEQAKEALGQLQNALEQETTMLRQQQAEIEGWKERVSIAYWHDTFVEVKKPNSDLIYRFRLDDVCKHGVDDGACKECYAEAQEK